PRKTQERAVPRTFPSRSSPRSWFPFAPSCQIGRPAASRREFRSPPYVRAAMVGRPRSRPGRTELGLARLGQVGLGLARLGLVAYEPLPSWAVDWAVDWAEA